MVSVVTIDESTSGARISGPKLLFDRSEITIRELIEARVRTEVDHYNRAKSDAFYGLVQPDDIENFLNGPKKRAFKPVNPDKQVAVALDAFERQRFLVLLPAGQATSLDQTVALRDEDEVSFLRLIPLIGG